MSFLMSVGTLLTVFRLLPCRAATVSTGDVFLLLRLGLYLVIFFLGTTASSETDAMLKNQAEIFLFAHSLMME